MSEIERDGFSAREMYLMRQAYEAGRLVGEVETLDSWLGEPISDAGHYVAQHLAHDAERLYGQAAREQEGGEAVGTAMQSPSQTSYTIATFDANKAPPGAKLYIHPHKQQGGVPEGWRSQVEKALGLAKVFDDGGDGADGESAASVVSILAALLSTPAAPQADEWFKCSQRLPRIGQRVILKSKGIVQNYMPTLDEGEDEGYFWCFDDAIGDEDYPLVDFETDEWMSCPQPPEQGDGV